MNIILNGIIQSVTGKPLEHKTVVALAHDFDDDKKEKEWTKYMSVVYYKGPIANPEGMLLHGQFVEVCEDMVFNVCIYF